MHAMFYMLSIGHSATCDTRAYLHCAICFNEPVICSLVYLTFYVKKNSKLLYEAGIHKKEDILVYNRKVCKSHDLLIFF